MTERQRKLVDLLKHKQWMSTKDIAWSLKCSERTVRTELRLLDQIKRRFTATYAAVAMMNVDYHAVLQTIFRQYEEYRQLSAIAFDRNERVNVRLDASVELADLLDVPTDNVMRNTDDVRSFLKA